MASTTTLPSLPPVISVNACTFRAIPFGEDRIGDAHPFAHEAQPILVDVDDDGPRPGELGELDDAQADRPGADDEDRLIGLAGWRG